ncbi:G patch domain-containing protein 2 isoform X2 [Octopus bimaculoides]|uniref:G patch domain-containing protein 2 isoform X2 n=1 Tax=Octopus bimaculoides TaxID=37653 RepID=UPI0022DF2310|nr:G patch domain-containing protein 2 isoform X2 [Octopus bimaculoides]
MIERKRCLFFDMCDGSRQQMENYIVREFQNLHVLSTCNLEKMDELVQDLTNALEETSRNNGEENSAPTIIRRHYKKKKPRKRRSNTNLIWESGNFSEASESSLDEAFKDYIQSVVQHSDSDDLDVVKHLSQIGLPLPAMVPPVESDSVPETFSPTDTQRRRRKFRSMTVDPISCDHFTLTRCKTKGSRISTRQRMFHDGNMNLKCLTESDDAMNILPGKRKRSRKYDFFCTNGSNSGDIRKIELSSFNHDNTSSSLSSSESDAGLITNDESREADDEQSDFYYEPGSACGVPSIIPIWETDKMDDEDKEDEFQKIFTGTFEHLPKSSQLSYTARVKKLMCGRQIRSGRRKLKGKIPGYSMSRFLQEQQKWNALQMRHRTSLHGHESCDHKRQRKITSCEGCQGEDTDTISESNGGNHLLHNTSLKTGSEHSLSGEGVAQPIQTDIYKI